MPSLRDWSDWASTSWRLPGTGPGALLLTGNVDASQGKIKLTNAALSLDDIRATGQLSVDTTGPRPLIQGLVDMDRFDVDSYWPGTPAPVPGADNGPGIDGGSDIWGNLPPAGSGPPARGRAPASIDWDSQPIDWSALHLVDADLSLSAGQIYFRGLRLGRSSIDLHLHDRRLELALNRFQLYDGFGRGSVSIYDDGAKPTYQGRFNLSDIQLAPMLKDLVGFDKLTGVGTIDLNLSSSGRSDREIVGNLSGSGSIGINNGGLRDINLNAMMRTPATAGALGQPADVTVFNAASIGVAVAEGNVRSRELTLRLPSVTVTGSGTVNLPRREMAVRLTPHAAGMTSIEIGGPWSRLTYHAASPISYGVRSVRRPARSQSSGGPLRFLRRLFGGD
jgi:AsmA protein